MAEGEHNHLCRTESATQAEQLYESRSRRQTADINDKELAQLLTSRIRRIFEIAAANGNEALILGAFGCGAFKNPPIVVAKVFAEQLQAFRGCFKAIEFAVFHTEREAGNYNAFKAAIR